MDKLLIDVETSQNIYRHSKINMKKERRQNSQKLKSSPIQTELLNEGDKTQEIKEEEEFLRKPSQINQSLFSRIRSRDSQQISRVQSKLELKKRGRPPKFKNIQEKKKNKLERDRINQQNYRKRKREEEKENDQHVKREVQRLNKVIEEQQREIQTLKNLRKFPSLSQELNLILSKKAIKSEGILTSSEWIDDQEDQVKQILNAQYQKYVAELLEALEDQTSDAIRAVESFLIKFVKQGVTHIEQAFEGLAQEDCE